MPDTRLAEEAVMPVALPQRKELVLLPGMTLNGPVLPVYTVHSWLDDVFSAPTSTTIVVPAKVPTPRALRSPITQPGYNLGRPNKNKGKRFPATPPTPAEALRVLDITGHGKIGIRNRALLATLWRSALRISEACDLLPWHINFDESSVFVACGKGGKTRTVGIDAGALKEISRWLMVRATLPIHDPDQQPLFCTVCLPDPGNRLNPAYVRHTLARLGKRAKVPHRIACHQWRHAFAVDATREGMPLPLLQRQLGHSSLATTATYLSSISAFEVVELVSKREWPGGTGA